MDEALGVTRNGVISWPGKVASVDVDAVDPSPQTILDAVCLGLMRRCDVGFKFRPAPVSMIKSPSILFELAKISLSVLFIFAEATGTTW